MTAKTTRKAKGEHMIRDIGLADFGRKEIEIAEYEMPGLMAIREKYSKAKPLAGIRIMGCLHMTIQTAVLIETLAELGADLRWCSCNIFSTQDHAAAAIAKRGIPVFAYKGESIPEYWQFVMKAMIWPDGKGPDQIVDDGGDATGLIHMGVKGELDPAFLKTAPKSADERAVFAILKEVRKKDRRFWQKIAANMKGVSEETTTGIHRLNHLAKTGELLFPAVNVNDSVTKSKFDNVYGCRHSLPDGLKRALDVLLSGKQVVVCGYGDVGKGCAEAMKNERARVVVTEVDPICALQACMAGFQVARIEDALKTADVYVTCTGNCRIITAKHMAAMKDQAIVCNIGHFDDEIDVAGLKAVRGIEVTEIKGCECPVHKYTFPDGHSIYLLAEGRLVNLGCATGHPNFVMSCSFSNQVLAQIEIAGKKLEKKVHLIPKILDEEVARLHLAKCGAKLSKLTREQADYIGVKVSGPFKPDGYRY